jgi:hypothetical protein
MKGERDVPASGAGKLSNNQSRWRSHFGVHSITELKIDSGVHFPLGSTLVGVSGDAHDTISP